MSTHTNIQQTSFSRTSPTSFPLLPLSNITVEPNLHNTLHTQTNYAASMNPFSSNFRNTQNPETNYVNKSTKPTNIYNTYI